MSEQVVQIVPHEAHQQLAADAAYFRLTYEGGSRYKCGTDARGAAILPQYEYETKDMHAARLSATAVVNVAQDVVPKRVGEIFSQPVARPQLDGERVDEVLAAWAKNVDRSGTSLAEWMAARLQDALIDRMVYLGVDAPMRAVDGNGTTAPLSRADVMGDASLRPYLVHAAVDRVIDWDEDDAGNLTRIVVAYERRTKGSLTEAARKTETWIEWTAQSWRRYAKDDRGRVFVEAESEHDFGRVPWLRFEPIPGMSYVGRLAEWQQAATRTLSHMEAEEVACVFTLMVIIGADPTLLAKSAVGSGQALVIPGQDIEIKTIAGDPTVMDSLRSNLAMKVAQAYQRAESTDGVKHVQPESGVARAYAFMGLEAILQGIAKRTQDAENELLRLWAAAMNEGEERASEFAVTEYPQEFDILSDEALFSRYQWLLENADLPIEVRRLALEDIVTRLFPVNDDRRDAVIKSIQDWTTSPASRLLGAALPGGFPNAPAPAPFGGRASAPDGFRGLGVVRNV